MKKEKEIREMVRRMREGFAPERVILFGSYATGRAGYDSDVDLLVVMPVRKSKRMAAVEIGVALNDIPMAKDIVVTTPEEFAWRKEVVGAVERPAAQP